MYGSWVRVPADTQIEKIIMKSLEDYITKDLDYCQSNSKIYHEQQMIIEDFFSDDVPQDFRTIFKESNTIRSTNFITDFLKSVSDDIIIKQLNKIDDSIFIQKCDDKIFANDKQKCFQLLSKYDISKDERFVNMIEKFGYHISDSENEPFGFVFFIEPNYTDDMNEYVQDCFMVLFII